MNAMGQFSIHERQILAALLRRNEFGEQRLCQRQFHPHADPKDESVHPKHQRIRRRGAQIAAHTPHDHADLKERFPPEPVREQSRAHRADRHSDKAGASQHAGFGCRQSEFRFYRSQKVRHHGQIEIIEEERQANDQKKEPVITTKRQPFQPIARVDFHCGLP
nr:hypothetical protein [Azospirillum sp. INR13]